MKAISGVSKRSVGNLLPTPRGRPSFRIQVYDNGRVVRLKVVFEDFLYEWETRQTR